jgi:hypothetical protein
MLFFYFGHSKKICNPPIFKSNDTNIAQFGEGMRKILKNV